MLVHGKLQNLSLNIHFYCNANKNCLLPVTFSLLESRLVKIVKGESLGGKGLTEPICLNPFPPRPAQMSHI